MNTIHRVRVIGTQQWPFIIDKPESHFKVLKQFYKSIPNCEIPKLDSVTWAYH